MSLLVDGMGWGLSPPKNNKIAKKQQYRKQQKDRRAGKSLGLIDISTRKRLFCLLRVIPYLPMTLAKGGAENFY